MPVTRIAEFDTWRPGYAGATVRVYRAGSTVLADIFTDEALTIPATNPQVLISLTEDDISYGKFSATIYLEQAFELQIDNIDTTGVIRPPLTTVTGEDISGGIITPDGATQSHTLAEIAARIVYAVDYGEFLATGEPGASSATNNATLVTAIGVVAAAGAGEVHIPSGVYDFISFTIPDSVKIVGVGESATFLQSTYAGPVITLGGPRAGFSDLTFDGISQQVNSVGVFGVAIDESQIQRAIVKRFETGAYCRGGQRNRWIEFTVSDCVYGAKLHGDLNAGAGGGGEAFEGNTWDGGTVEFCSTAGIELKRIDAVCAFNSLRDISFTDNPGKALSYVGCRSIDTDGLIFDGNTTDLNIEDGTPLDVNNTIVDIAMKGGKFTTGALNLSGNLENVLFDRVEFTAVAITLTNPKHNVLARDCREDSAVTLAGQATAWLRTTTNDHGASFGLTTGNAATKTWAMTLVSGQMVLLEAKILGRQRNGVNRATYWIANTGRRAPATLNYDTQTGNFTVGNIITGGTSGATARIIADADSGTTGALSIQDVEGVFVDNEIITDGATGSATANGGIVEGAVSVGTGNALRTVEETDVNWDAAFVANGPEIELRVTGATGQTVEWTADVDVVTT